MREILFRGKRKDDGSWVEGGVLQIPGYTAICAYTDYHGWHDFIEVVPETVGQYTGLTDKSGKRIFEGDILAFVDDYGTKTPTGIMKFGAFNCSCYTGVYGWYISGDGDIRNFEDDMTNPNYEIIGNIHDNPELLEGGE